MPGASSIGGELSGCRSAVFQAAVRCPEAGDVRIFPGGIRGAGASLVKGRLHQGVRLQWSLADGSVDVFAVPILLVVPEHLLLRVVLHVSWSCQSSWIRLALAGVVGNGSFSAPRTTDPGEKGNTCFITCTCTNN